ncbi:MAG: asparagine synthetase B [candidate division WOR-3 bacterium]|nr:asparagine synthetase B [candidate division WOR-3 bacterium]
MNLLLMLAISGKLLIPMDLSQTNHLKAYGIAYHALERGEKVEWLLNYRGGSFLVESSKWSEKECLLAGVRVVEIDIGAEAAIRATIEESNMNAVLLEKAPKVAVYAPPTADPWDDAVRLALEYAEIPYDVIWDPQVLAGKLADYDWVHLHHEDFTGQYGKFYYNYHNADWYKEQVRLNEQTAKKLGFDGVPKLKLAVAKVIKRYVLEGGFLFAMCSATDTYDIALAAEATDIVHQIFDGTPMDKDCQEKLDYSQTFAFENFTLVMDPYRYEHSDIDVSEGSVARGPDAVFALFDFSARFDPVPCMLVQDHTALCKEFLGQNTGFNRKFLKRDVLVLGEVKGTEEVKYIHGNRGEGTFTFLGGHDPEDYAHRIGDPPTDLELYRNSPGYRLILNNVLFPAAERKPLKT